MTSNNEFRNRPAGILDDPRPIWKISEGDRGLYQVGANCHSIIAYGEPGQGAFVPFYAVRDYHEQIIARVPAYLVVVEYAC